MASVSQDRLRRQLQQEVKDVIEEAVRALQEGQSVAYAQSRLQEISNRLSKLEIEFRGGCTW